jgi:MerR family transcriptional regulator, mercuric resistance operon regulatory protein
MPQSYTIARLAAAAGVHVETIRYYQRRGLVPEPVRPAGGVRRYTAADAERLRFIKRAQTMGFTLAEIAHLLRLRARCSCRATRELAAAKLQDLDRRICELRGLRKELAHLIHDCDGNADEATCPVIERLAVETRNDDRLTFT